MEVYPIPIKHATCYLVKVSDFYIAIDAGWAGNINEYLKMMHKYGINKDKIRYLFVTHFHPDHAGLVEDIKHFGTTFVIMKHQIPYIESMEKMLVSPMAKKII
ncbi:MBL fold metallo-hydrolase [Lachnoclostridium sp.]|uniref:MBL fold metallo-hydrolase n=1 Tax=Lachnoclostridium sp. TaxID=2028282 RepID=UPI00289D8FE4|nr:MBL fold metallo-hydrolase [Lachnoclostridium sp.]